MKNYLWAVVKRIRSGALINRQRDEAEKRIERRGHLAFIPFLFAQNRGAGIGVGRPVEHPYLAVRHHHSLVVIPAGMYCVARSVCA